MAFKSCYEGSPSPPRGAIVGGTRFAYDRAEPSEPGKRPRPPAGGRRHCRAGARCRDAAIPRRPQSRAARGGGDAGGTGAGAGRCRHRQDPRADLAHRPYPQHGPGTSQRNPLGHLHQQGSARDEAAARPDAGPGGRGHAVARHLSLDRRTHPAFSCRTGAVEIQLHRARRRRPDPALEAAPAGRQYRRQALAGAHAGRVDRRLEEPRAGALAGAAGRSVGVRQWPRRQTLCALSGTAENPQRRRFRRSATGEHPAVPRTSRCAPKLPEPLQVHPGRRIPGHQRRAISVAAAVVAGAGFAAKTVPIPSGDAAPRRGSAGRGADRR